MTIGIVKEAEKANDKAQKESILEKIEADIYTKKIKKGRSLTKSEVEEILKEYRKYKG